MRLLILAVTVMVSTFITAQNHNYDLTEATRQEYKEIVDEIEDMNIAENVFALAFFWDVYESSSIEGTFKVVITGADWNGYLEALEGLQAHVKGRLAEVYGANALRCTGDDAKFWRMMYEAL